MLFFQIIYININKVFNAISSCVIYCAPIQRRGRSKPHPHLFIFIYGAVLWLVSDFTQSQIYSFHMVFIEIFCYPAELHTDVWYIIHLLTGDQLISCIFVWSQKDLVQSHEVFACYFHETGGLFEWQLCYKMNLYICSVFKRHQQKDNIRAIKYNL